MKGVVLIGRKEKPYRIGGYTVQMEKILRSGRAQGWKVHIDDTKYPKEYGYWYTMNREEAFKYAWGTFGRDIGVIKT